MTEGTPIIIKKKKVHGHGHHGGAWKVAYADFVTAMMAFFLVMWILGMSQAEREVIQGYFRDPIGFTENPPRTKVNIFPAGAKNEQPEATAGADNGQRQEIMALQSMYEKVEEEIKKDPELEQLEAKGAVNSTLTPEGLQIELAENDTNSEVFFELGSAVVRPTARKVLAKLAPVLAKFGRPLVLDGHTDARPLSNGVYDNMALSALRANAVRVLMRSGGVAESQIVVVRAYGDKKPRRPEDPMHFSNRRVSLLIPYKVVEQEIRGLPADVQRESIEGVFRMPAEVAPVTPDLAHD